MAIYMPRSIRPFSGPGRDWTEVSISGTIAPKQHQKVTQHEVFFYSNRNWRVPQEFVGSVLSITSTNVVNSIMTPKRTIFYFFKIPDIRFAALLNPLALPWAPKEYVFLAWFTIEVVLHLTACWLHLTAGSGWAEKIIYIYILVGGLKHFLFSIIYGIIFPIDFHIFQDG